MFEKPPKMTSYQLQIGERKRLITQEISLQLCPKTFREMATLEPESLLPIRCCILEAETPAQVKS